MDCACDDCLQNGDIHLSVSAINVVLGTQIQKRAVYPTTTAPAGQTDRSLTSEQQLQAAVQSGDAVAVVCGLRGSSGCWAAC